MQSNLNNLQFQQMQILQQQQRLANMMQQKQRGFPQQLQQQQPWEESSQFNKQQQLLLQQQQQQLQQQQARAAQKDMNMMRPQVIPQPNLIPSKQPVQPSLQQPVVPSVSSPVIPTPPENAISVKTEAQQKNLMQYQRRDDVYQETLNLQHKRHIELAQSKKKSIEIASMERRTRMQHGAAVAFGPGYRGYGNGRTGMSSRIRFPRDNKRRSRTAKRDRFRFPLDALKEQSVKEEVLVPIRIELEHEGYKLRDTFTWNLNESLVTPEQFAEVMCEDLRLPITVFSDQIARSIREQIDDYNLNASSMMKDDTEESNEQKLETLDLLAHPEQADKEEIEVNHDKQGVELRTLIKLDITVGNWELVDQFEWDIGYPRNSPEEFAHKLATDLGLSGEFKTAIAHSIREQIHVYIKSLLLVGYEFNNTSIIDDEIRNSFLPHLRNIIRESSSIERFTPSMIELSDAAVAKAEKDRMREARRKRRGTRARRGIILPDREPQKTHRTGFAVAPESELTDEQFLQNQLNDPQSNKRSAALKARMNIAAEAANVGDDLIEEAPAQHHHHHQQQQQMQGSISFANTIKMNDFQRQVMKQNQMNAWQQQQFR
ncbi:SWI/SNF chromatin-remodeling complex subunit [Mucor circinelloides]